MSGLTITEFDCLFECVQPFIGAMIYPDCKESESTPHVRKLDKKNRTSMLFINMQTCPTSWSNGMDDRYY